ncbi:MAG: transcription termination/antitermination factor NusG [Candidatus Saganbacteria bacterium]|nr:transcription termination/antitermination factor NusG [Candidatus Saganbacteria bacterium]
MEDDNKKLENEINKEKVGQDTVLPVQEKAAASDEVKKENPPQEEKTVEQNEPVQDQEKAAEEVEAEKPVEAVVEETAKEPEQEIKQEVKKTIKGEKRWYVIQTYSGQEEKVQEALMQTIDMLHLQEVVAQILIPEEEIVELKGRKRIEKKRKMFPGYVFLEMILTEETWYAIRQTPGVSRFIGTKVKPTPVSDREMQRVLKQIGAKEEKLEIAFKKGETVRIISGPFRGYTGIIDEINPDKEKLKVLINIFGRDTPVEVNFEHAEKIV